VKRFAVTPAVVWSALALLSLPIIALHVSWSFSDEMAVAPFPFFASDTLGLNATFLGALRGLRVVWFVLSPLAATTIICMASSPESSLRDAWATLLASPVVLLLLAIGEGTRVLESRAYWSGQLALAAVFVPWLTMLIVIGARRRSHLRRLARSGAQPEG
jgi:hypothetical protein